MSAVKDIEKLLKKLIKKISSVTKDSFAIDAVNGSVDRSIREIAQLITPLATAVSRDVPELPATFRSMDRFISQASEIVIEYNNQFSDTWAPSYSDVLMLSQFKDDIDKASSDIGNRYGDPRIFNLRNDLTATKNAFEAIYTTNESRRIQSIDRSNRIIQEANVLNGETVLHKMNTVVSELAALTPSSKISQNNKATVLKLSPWELDVSDQRVNYNIYGSENAPGNGLGLPNSLYVSKIDFSGTITPEEFEFEPTSPHDYAILWFTVDGGVQNSMPPKTSCYDWRANLRLELSFDTGDATWLAVKTGNQYAYLDIYVKGTDGMTVEIITKKLDWSLNGDTYSGVLNIGVPYAGGKVGLDMTLRVDDVADLEFMMRVTGSKLVGIPKTDECDITSVDYRVNGALQQLNGSEVWSELFGKLDIDLGRDPNWSLESVWNDRSHNDEIKFTEIVHSLEKYSDFRWGGGENDPSINDKYLDLNPLCGGLVGVAKSNMWLYSSGPFGGMSNDDINKMLSMLYGDMREALSAVQSNSEFARFLISRNATSTSSLITY